MVGCSSRKFTIEDRQKWRLKRLKHWRDLMEQRMSGLNASIETLEAQIERDTQVDKVNLNED